jgi:allophanate hydrolase subunit 2
VRAYLAVRGGIDVPSVLGSRSRDTLAALGPPPPLAGDLLPIGTAATGWPVLEVAPVPEPGPGPVVLRLLPGPWPDARGRGGLRALLEPDWRVAADSDRVGLRLEGPGIAADGPADRTAGGGSWPSAALVRGAVQVPPGGEPVLFLADHPVTGGYPVLACLLDAETDRAAQVRPGQTVRFRLATEGH